MSQDTWMHAKKTQHEVAKPRNTLLLCKQPAQRKLLWGVTGTRGCFSTRSGKHGSAQAPLQPWAQILGEDDTLIWITRLQRRKDTSPRKVNEMVTAPGRQSNRCPGQGLREERNYTGSSFAIVVEGVTYVLHCFSRVWVFATPRTVARQSPLSMGFSRQEYWSRLPCPPPGDLPDPGIKPGSPALQADSLPLSHLEACLL